LKEEMTATPGIEVQADVPRNLLVIRYLGHVAASEMKAYCEKVKNVLPQMRNGFTLVADLSGLESMELDCMTGVTEIMDACKAKSVGTVVRIIPDPHKDIGLNILSIVHYRRGVRVVTCETAAEAERVTKATR
jgi:hypothetical protein